MARDDGRAWTFCRGFSSALQKSCVRARARVWLCVCVCARARARVCVCVEFVSASLRQRVCE